MVNLGGLVVGFLLCAAKERRRVENFFAKSETSAQPVVSPPSPSLSPYLHSSPLKALAVCDYPPQSMQRRRSTDQVFTPTNMKNLLVTGVFGEKVSPCNSVANGYIILKVCFSVSSYLTI